MKRAFRVIVDRDKCIACGAAPSACPEVFVLAEDNGKNAVTEKYELERAPHISVGVVPEELYECVKSAAEICPVAAITIREVEE